MSLTIKNFNVLNTTTGQMAISGRTTNDVLLIIDSQYDVINNLQTGVDVVGAPTTISGGLMYGIGHMGSTYIKLVTDYMLKSSDNIVFVPDAFIRVTYLGGTTTNSDSLLYGFATSPTDTNITFNVVFAKSISQTVGDYFDIPFPDTTFYPNLYVVFYLLNGAWDNRVIVSGTTCSIVSTGCTSYCINPAYSGTEVGESHFVFVNGFNQVYGMATRISVGVEDELLTVSKDYANVKFAIASSYLDAVQTNDMYVGIPICYVKGTRILCFVDGEEKEVLIEDITVGMLVKTLNNGYRKILHKTHSSFVNSKHKLHNRVYKMIGNDLYVSGGHSIMVDELKDNEKEYGERKIQNKYCLLSCLSDKFVAVNEKIRFEIYHITVGESDIVWANGILSETFDLDWYERCFLRRKVV
jgi:hypothetical protein